MTPYHPLAFQFRAIPFIFSYLSFWQWCDGCLRQYIIDNISSTIYHRQYITDNISSSIILIHPTISWVSIYFQSKLLLLHEVFCAYFLKIQYLFLLFSFSFLFCVWGCRFHSIIVNGLQYCAYVKGIFPLRYYLFVTSYLINWYGTLLDSYTFLGRSSSIFNCMHTRHNFIHRCLCNNIISKCATNYKISFDFGQCHTSRQTVKSSIVHCHLLT